MRSVWSALPLCSGSVLQVGGRSPVRWQHAANRVGWQMREFERSTAWISSFEESRPWLRRGPLLGHALDFVTGESSRAPVNSDSRKAIRQKRKGSVEALQNVRHARTAVSRRSKNRENVDTFQFPAQAGREFLASLAEGRRPAKPMRERVEQQPPETKPDWLPSNFPPQTPSEARSAFANRLSGRLAKSLGDLSFSHSRWGGILDQAWATPLDGPEANPELLNTATPPPSADWAGAKRNGVSGIRTDSARPLAPERSNAPGMSIGPYGQSASPPAASPPPSSDEFPSASPFGSSWFESLNVSPREGRPAAIARMPTAEEASFDWDVEALSVGIKRILDNEARRHGIDV